MNYIRQKDIKLLIFTHTELCFIIKTTTKNRPKKLHVEFSKVQQTFYKNCDKCMKSI